MKMDRDCVLSIHCTHSHAPILLSYHTSLPIVLTSDKSSVQWFEIFVDSLILWIVLYCGHLNLLLIAIAPGDALNHPLFTG